MSATEKNLNKLIAQLEARNAELEDELSKATDRIDTLECIREEGRDTWAFPRKWDEKGLPLPRLEMHWSRSDEDGWNLRCLYVLVYAHLLDGCGGKRHIVAKPLGMTRSNRSVPVSSFIETRGMPGEAREIIATPFRDGAHAMHDAKHLNLPLYVTTEDDDAAIVEGDGQRIIRRAGKAA